MSWTPRQHIEEDVPGASLIMKGKSVDLLTVVELKRWLACRGARRRSGKKPELRSGKFGTIVFRGLVQRFLQRRRVVFLVLQSERVHCLGPLQGDNRPRRWREHREEARAFAII